MRKSVALALSLLLLCGGDAMAKTVTVDGYGTTQTEAERDAMRNAVEESVGSLIDSQTLTKNFELVSDTIYASCEGYVEDMQVLATYPTADGGYKVTASVNVNTSPDAKLMSDLMRHKIIDVNMRDAKIAVVIPETHLRRRLLDPAGETAVVKKFVEAGFQNVIDISEKRWNYNQPEFMSADELQNLAHSLQADILVVGEAFSEYVGDVNQYLPSRSKYNPGPRTGVVSCRARVEAKMYITRTGQIIAADGTYGSGADIAEAIAAKKALCQAGEKMGDYLVGQLMNTFSGSRQAFELTVIANSINDVNRVKRALSTVPGVNGANLNSYSNNRATISVKYAGSPTTLFDLLQRETDVDLEMRESTFNTLTVAVR